MKDLIEVLKDYPSIKLTITAGDLMEMVDCFVSKHQAVYGGKKMPEQYASRIETSEILDVTVGTVYRYGKKGILRPTKIGGRTMYKMSEIDKILKEGGAA